MLNRAARYFPILTELRKYVGTDDDILEVGSGAYGVGEFWSRPFVGCDIVFEVQPRRPMRPVMSSGWQLPFKDASFSGVIASDVMEHVAPCKRRQVIAEVLRVTRKVAIFGYPCGHEAFEVDKRLRRDYQTKGLVVPTWLEEHMLHPFPDSDLFCDLPPGWKVMTTIPNESLAFHYWVMRKEMNRSVDRLFRLGLLLVPAAMRTLLRKMDREPAYRRLFVIIR